MLLTYIFIFTLALAAGKAVAQPGDNFNDGVHQALQDVHVERMRDHAEKARSAGGISASKEEKSFASQVGAKHSPAIGEHQLGIKVHLDQYTAAHHHHHGQGGQGH